MLRNSLSKEIRFRLWNGWHGLHVASPHAFCPLCETPVAKWKRGSGKRNKMQCPRCSSKPRHRLVWRGLYKYAANFGPQSKVLHIAPERSLVSRLAELLGDNYYPCDLNGERFGVKYSFPIEQIPFPDRTFDVIICNHVLEHVDSDSAAMKEFGRVLKSDGVVLVTIPADPSRATTYEDFSITSPEERAIHFGQYDHVRLFGADAAMRLSQDNIAVEEVAASSVEPRLRAYGIRDNEPLFVGRRRRST